MSSVLGAGARTQVGRYVLCDEIAAGGMAAVYLSRMRAPTGFAKTVAIKRLHRNYATSSDVVSMFLDEARLAERIRHTNVVSTLDVVAHDDEVLLVMDYVPGESLSRLLGDERPPLAITLSVMLGVLYGLHAAHEARDEHGEPLGIVHRDVSPANVLLGTDGIARLLDFGIAKAAHRLHVTRDGQIKGKLRYLSPKQLMQKPVDRRADVYAACVVLWEALTGELCYAADDPNEVVARIHRGDVVPPSRLVPSLPPSIDAIVRRGLARDPAERFATALDLARALEEVDQQASPIDVGEWVQRVAKDALEERAALVRALETTESDAVEEPADAAKTASSGSRRKPPSRQRRVDPHAHTTLDADVPTKQRRRGPRTALAAAAGFVVLAGAWWIATHRAAPSASTAPRDRAEPAILASAPVEPAPSSASTPTPSPAPVRVTAATAMTPSVTAPRRHPPAPATSRRECDPPYVLFPDGAKRYKPECL